MVVKIGKTVLFQKLSYIFEKNSKAYRDIVYDEMTEEEVIK